MDELSTLQHYLINDRVLTLAQRALEVGMKYAVMDMHNHEGAIRVITVSYSMADGIANAGCTLQGAAPRRLLVISLTSIVALGLAHRGSHLSQPAWPAKDREVPRHANGLRPANGAA